MIIHIEASVPPKYFKSSRKDNGFESVSERTAKVLMNDILGIPYERIKRGNEKLNEPDYVVGGEGYEVTFAVDSSKIVQMTGVKPLNSEASLIEAGLISDIVAAVERKSHKKYSCNTSVIALLADMLIDWYSEYVYDTDKWIERIVCEDKVKRRNELLDVIFDKYIGNGCFKNVYIVMPTHDQGILLIDIGRRRQNKDDWIQRIVIRPDNLKAFLTYKVQSIEEREIPGIVYEISIINYK